MGADSPLIVFEKVSLYVGERRFLHQIDLTVHEGETLVVAGLPGCGKSFILRLVLGMPGVPRGESVQLEGEVSVCGQSLLQLNGAALQKLRMQMGSVLWGGGLIDNMDIRRNITLPLYYHFRDVMRAADIEARCSVLLAEMQLEHLDRPGRRPVSLNQEEIVCVGLARALINEPHVLLLDDPTVGLSPASTSRLVRFLFYRPEFADRTKVHDRAGRPVTRLIATTNLDDYLDCGDCFAVIHDQELRIVGDREAVLQSDDPCVKNLLSTKEYTG